MDEKSPSNSEIINNVRNLAISRRGGVRTRGGRLPPINIQALTTSSKKMVAPNIPQRRKVIKTETESSEQSVVKTENQTYFENTRGRSRPQRVYLQTEGSFLAEGPAARLKRDPVYNDNISIPRVCRRSAKGSSDKNIDADAVKDLMDSYIAGEEYENYNEGKPPFRLPIQKEKVTCKVKLKSDENDKTKIKKEIIEDFETLIKKEIKTEKDDDEDFIIAKDDIKEETESKKSLADRFQKIKAEKDNEDFVFTKDGIKEEETESKTSLADRFVTDKDDTTLLLLQLPLLSASSKTEDHEMDKAAKEKDKQPVNENELKATKFLDNFEEGFIGKLKIMKSGRMKLTLGSVEYELLDGTPSETYQEAVSIKVQDQEGDVAVLGKIEKKLLLSPIIDKLIAENINKSKTLKYGEE